MHSVNIDMHMYIIGVKPLMRMSPVYLLNPCFSNRIIKNNFLRNISFIRPNIDCTISGKLGSIMAFPYSTNHFNVPKHSNCLVFILTFCFKIL